ncbi:MAG: hypothetical protein HDR97_00425 [Bacteroides sp.]|nr:hypothetical protein [Bacteroides sp.]
MDKEKLNEAARENVRKYPHQHRSYTFRQGADWIMQQPLSERLTEDEKEKIKAKYNELKSLNSITNEMFADDTAILEWLFGKGLFNEK